LTQANAKGLDKAEEDENAGGKGKSHQLTKMLRMLSKYLSLLEILSLPFRVIYSFHKDLLLMWDDNCWHNPAWPPKLRRNYNFTSCPTIPIERIKRIRRVQGDIKFFTVVLAGLTGGIRKYKYGVRIPAEIHVIVATPAPKHSQKLSNDL
jgi:hypothetical protein